MMKKQLDLIESTVAINNLFMLIQNASLGFPKRISGDIQAGITYALSTLEEDEQQVLLLLCKDKLEYGVIAEQMNLTEEEILRLEKEAVRKLRSPGRWDYICHGVRGYLRMRLSQERAIAYRSGYMDGYQKGQTEQNMVPDNILDMPIEVLDLSVRAKQCFLRKGIKTVREIASMEEAQILRIRGMGAKTTAEVAHALRRQGVTYTLWDKFHLEEE